MVYSEVGIHSLSPSQKLKMKKMQPVRMKLGSHHKLPLRVDQIKKLSSAHKKGSAVEIVLDPYQIDHLHGSGFFDSIKKAFSSPAAKAISQALRPVATNMARSALSSLGPTGQVIGNTLIDKANEVAESHGYGLKKVGRPRKVGRPKKHYVHHDVRMVEPEELGLRVDKRRGKKVSDLMGSGFFDSLKKVATSDVAKNLSKSLRPMATDYLRSKLPSEGILHTLGNAGLDLANRQAEKHGYGAKPKTAKKTTKRVGRPRKGGALIAAGYHG